MDRKQFRQLNSNGKLITQRTIFPNVLPSSTDPTQNVTVQQVFNAAMTGHPLDIKQNTVTYNNLHADQLCSIDKRNNDKFDAFLEMKLTKGTIDQKIGNIDRKRKQQLKQIEENEKQED